MTAFIRLRQPARADSGRPGNTLRLAAGMNGEVNHAKARLSEGGLASAEFR